MASFFGTMATGLGKGLMQYGQTTHQGNLAALRQKSLEQRWAAQDSAQNARAKEQTRQFKVTTEATAGHRADVKRDKKIQNFNGEVSSILDAANKQKANIQKQIDNDEITPPENVSMADYVAGLQAEIDKGAEARLRTITESAGSDIVDGSLYRSMFVKAKPPENTGAETGSGAGAGLDFDFDDLLARSKRPQKANETQNTSRPDDEVGLIQKGINMLGLGGGGDTPSTKGASLKDSMTMTAEEESTASNILAGLSRGLQPADMTKFEQEFLASNSWRMEGLNEARKAGGQSPSSRPRVAADDRSNTKPIPQGSAPQGLMSQPAQVQQPSKDEIIAFRLIKNKTKGVDAFLHGAFQDGAFKGASDEQIESLIAQINDAASDEERYSLIQSFTNRQI